MATYALPVSCISPIYLSLYTEMSLLGIGDNLPDLVHARFEAARKSGALKLASSHLAILDVSGTSVGMFTLLNVIAYRH